MPINPLVLQQRHNELGRIRIGDQVATGNGGTRPNKLTTFRFTSGNEGYIRALAARYGGEAKPWKNGSKNEWEVYTNAKSVPVVVLKSGLSQWFEFWSAGGCIHRCDGITNVLTDEPCDMTEQVKVGRKTVNPHSEAKPTTRISMMLAELDSIGAWRLETHGWNAAAEIPAVAEIAAFVGSMVPAVLHLMERTSVKDGKTSQFVVPVLDLQIPAGKLNEIVAHKMGQPLAIAGGEQHQVPGTAGALPAGQQVPDYLAQAQQCSTLPAVQAIWHKAVDAGDMTDELNAQLNQIGDSLKNAAAAHSGGPDADGAYDAVVVNEGAAAAADMAWQQVLTVAGKAGLTLEQTNVEYAAWSQGEQVSEASAEQLDAFRQSLLSDHDVDVPA